MTQSQVAAYMADKLGLTKKQGKTVLEELNALVVRELKKEGSLRLAGLGIFRKRKTKARMGRNPATGQEIKIPARTLGSRHQVISRLICEPRETDAIRFSRFAFSCHSFPPGLRRDAGLRASRARSRNSRIRISYPRSDGS